ENEALHRLGIFREADGILDQFAGGGGVERLEVGKKIAGLRKINLGLFVIAAMYGVIGALEQAVFAVLDELDGGIRVLRVQMLQHPGGHDDRGGDVVLHLQFVGGMKILAQAEHAPRAIGIVTDAQKI